MKGIKVYLYKYIYSWLPLKKIMRNYLKGNNTDVSGVEVKMKLIYFTLFLVLSDLTLI